MPTPEEVEAMKKRLIADPNTAELAKTLKMGFDEYVALVMKYASNPKIEPQLMIYDDAALKEAGFPPPDLKEVERFLQEYVDAAEISTKSKFADPNSQREKVSGAGALPSAPPATAKPEEVREDLKADLERARNSGKFKKF